MFLRKSDKKGSVVNEFSFIKIVLNKYIRYLTSNLEIKSLGLISFNAQASGMNDLMSSEGYSSIGLIIKKVLK